MTTFTNNAEGGTDTVAVTTGNSGGASGTAWTTVTPGTGGVINFSATESYTGSLAYQFTPAAATDCELLYNFGAGSEVTVRLYAYLTGQPTTATQFIRIGTVGTLTANMALQNVGASGFKFIVQNSAGTTIYSSSYTLSINTWYRFELGLILGSSGSLDAAVYLGNNTTALDSYSTSSTTLSAPNIYELMIGKLSATGNFPTFYVDDIYADNSTNAPVGPISSSSFTGLVSISNMASINV